MDARWSRAGRRARKQRGRQRNRDGARHRPGDWRNGAALHSLADHGTVAAGADATLALGLRVEFLELWAQFGPRLAHIRVGERNLLGAPAGVADLVMYQRAVKPEGDLAQLSAELA